MRDQLAPRPSLGRSSRLVLRCKRLSGTSFRFARFIINVLNKAYEGGVLRHDIVTILEHSPKLLSSNHHDLIRLYTCLLRYLSIV